MKTSHIEVALIDSCGSDLSVVNAARVSFHKESEWEYPDDGPRLGMPTLQSKDERLINYLAKHNHKSPFNHAFLSFRIKAPIFVARQLVKHKFLPWNEVSRRYVDEEPEFYFPDKWRKRAEDKKQGSSSEEVLIPQHEYRLLGTTPFEATEAALEAYHYVLNKGVAPEQARMMLPQNIMTEWIWSGTLGAFCDMLRLRLKEDTQEETRAVARQVAAEVEKKFPVSYKALLGE